MKYHDYILAIANHMFRRSQGWTLAGAGSIVEGLARILPCWGGPFAGGDHGEDPMITTAPGKITGEGLIDHHLDAGFSASCKPVGWMIIMSFSDIMIGELQNFTYAMINVPWHTLVISLSPLWRTRAGRTWRPRWVISHLACWCGKEPFQRGPLSPNGVLSSLSPAARSGRTHTPKLTRSFA